MKTHFCPTAAYLAWGCAFIAGSSGCSAAIGLDDLTFDLDSSGGGTGGGGGTDTRTNTDEHETDTDSQSDTGTLNDCEGVIHFGDKDLEEVVRVAINAENPSSPLSDTDPITVQAASLVTDLYAGSQDISDLRGLECLLNLDRLMLHFNQVRNLWPLAGLEHLSELYLEANPVSDLSPLQDIESLRTLQISETTVDDFSSLEGLGLTSLVANQLSIPDLATLPAFPSLEELQLMDCGLTDFASISDTQFPRLEVLAISGNAVTNWSFLDSLSGLTGLWIRSTGITHTVLNLIPSTVTELDLSGNDLNASSMLWLKALSKLRSLWLENSSIEEVDWIYAKSMTSLVFLSLAGNKTTPNLNGLDTATSVQELNIQNVGNMTSLNTIPEAAAGRLRYLNASYNGALWDISRLQASTNLTILELVECDIISIDDLENLNDLEEVSLNNNQITDISALSDTPKIHGMNLSNNLISDISPLATNTGLGASGSNLGQGDTVLLASNDFNCDDASAKETISSLRSWGVTVDICL